MSWCVIHNNGSTSLPFLSSIVSKLFWVSRTEVQDIFGKLTWPVYMMAYAYHVRLSHHILDILFNMCVNCVGVGNYERRFFAVNEKIDCQAFFSNK